MDLLELAAIAPIVAVAVTASFSTCLLGATRASEARREGRRALGWLVLSVVAGLAVAALIATGIIVIVA